MIPAGDLVGVNPACSTTERRGPIGAAPLTDQRRPSARVLIETVLGRHGFSVEDIGAHGTSMEHRRRGQARDEAIYVAAVVHPGMSLASVAELFRRDTKTILHGQFLFQKRLFADKALAVRVFRVIDASMNQAGGMKRAAGGGR